MEIVDGMVEIEVPMRKHISEEYTTTVDGVDLVTAHGLSCERCWFGERGACASVCGLNKMWVEVK